MSDNYFKNVVEAALLAAGRPLQLSEIAELFEENARPELDVLRAALDALGADYSSRGIELKETATGFRIQVRKEMANEVSRLWPERPPKYSRALLETLALIAYRQPITRGEIEAVRGVAVNPNIIKTVIERNWVRVVGTRDVPGRPELLGTTKDFLDYFGLRALDELPPLAELKAMGEINLQLDLAKRGDSGSDDGSGSSGANGAGEGGSAGDTPGDSSAAAASAVAAAGVIAVVAVADAEDAGLANEAASAATRDDAVDEATSAAAEDLTEVATADAAATRDDAPSEPLVELVSDEPFVAYEHELHSVTITHVDVESDPGEVTVQVEAVSGASSDDDDAADDDDELSAGPQSSTELVAAPRDRDD
ncbi:MAG: SMC-Scp complex subunit ScpB [Gammaproteobacteria bacterium]